MLRRLLNGQQQKDPKHHVKGHEHRPDVVMPIKPAGVPQSVEQKVAHKRNKTGPPTPKRPAMCARASYHPPTGPAFGRLSAYAKGLRGDSDIGVLLLCVGTVLACAVVDKVRSHRLHPAFFWGGGASLIGMDVASYVAKIMI